MAEWPESSSSELNRYVVNPNPHCLGIQKASFVKMKISPGWLNQNISLKIKNASQKILTNFFVSEYFIQNVIFSMLLMIM
jgi:hypothetical protein